MALFAGAGEALLSLSLGWLCLLACLVVASIIVQLCGWLTFFALFPFEKGFKADLRLVADSFSLVGWC
ncbi:hypothetical protein F2Q70_00013364 [Brassica cretica]|uniref:Uncharacterized protein n=1 Tax=Brassica cretica TaxID=69181 RepID=A0A8S9MEM4_BRACR|nr:hypothetical protein F2Q70_00013364 [Brassica cretica]